MHNHRVESPSERKFLPGLVPLVAAALVAGAAACGAVGAWKLWADAQSRAQIEVSNLAVVLAEQANLSLQSVHLVMQDFVDDLREAKDDPTGAHPSIAYLYGHDALANRLRIMPQASYLAAVSADGKLLGSSQSWPLPGSDVAAGSDLAQCATSGAGQPFIGTLAWDRSRTGVAFPLVQCWPGESGQQPGLIVAGVSIDYLMTLYRTIGLPPGITVAIRRMDGTALVRFPNTGDEAPPRSLAVQDKGRLVAGRTLEGYPLQVEVGMAEERAFAVWQEQVTWIFSGGLFVALCLFVMAWRFVALLRRLHRVRRALMERNRALTTAQTHLRAQALSTEQTAQALRDSEARLARQAVVLETTLDHMNQGLMMVTADRKVAVCNRKAIEMLGLPPEFMRNQPSFSDVLAYQWQTEEFSSSPAEIKDLLRAGGILSQPHTYERTRPDGTILDVCSQPLAGGGVVRTYTDITARKIAETRLIYTAYHDELTGALNRYALRDRLDNAIASSPPGSLALLYLDLDRFKLVNDTLGHMIGDELLKQVAARMQSVLRPGDVVARLGGDEFATILADPADEAAVIAQAERLKAVVCMAYEVDLEDVHVGVSIGIALFPKDGSSVDALLRSADSALYRAKTGGRNAICCHESAVEAEDRGRLLLERDLRLALDREQFELLYQPIYDAETGLPMSCEALIRWRHPTRGLMTPDGFIPVAEATGVIKDIGRWVMDTACKEAATWALPIRVAVNLSSVQLAQPDLEQQVAHALEQSGLPPTRLDLEVTESVLISHSDQIRQTMLALQALGVRLVMDDFGTGHASLEALQGLPFQQIKIDRSFIETLFDRERCGAIVPAILSMASNMNLDVVAEGVSSMAQVAALRRLGCRYLQGYLLARPQTPEWIRTHLWHRTTALTDEVASGRLAVR